MANKFSKDILIQTTDPAAASRFYEDVLGFTRTGDDLSFKSFHGDNINLFLDEGESIGPVLEVVVDDLLSAKSRLETNGCTILKWESNGPRRYMKDPYGLTFNVRERQRT